MFAPSVAYADALRGITDLGLQPAVYCGYQADVDAGRVITNLRWQPAGQRDRFAQTQRLFVARTLVLAPDWTSRFFGLPGVLKPVAEDQPIHCPDGSLYGAAPPTPVAGVQLVMTFPQVAQAPYAQVTFAATTASATALYEVADLGLRLADPCYERQLAQAQTHGATPPAWHPMGQEASYAASHTFVVAAAPLITPTDWMLRLRALPDTTDIKTPYTPTC